MEGWHESVILRGTANLVSYKWTSDSPASDRTKRQKGGEARAEVQWIKKYSMQHEWASPNVLEPNEPTCQPPTLPTHGSRSFLKPLIRDEGLRPRPSFIARGLDVRARNTAFNRSHFPGGLPDKRSPRDLPFDSLSPIIFTMAWRGCSCSDAVAFLPNIILAIGEIHSRLV